MCKKLKLTAKFNIINIRKAKLNEKKKKFFSFCTYMRECGCWGNGAGGLVMKRVASGVKAKRKMKQNKRKRKKKRIIYNEYKLNFVMK